MKLGEFFLVLIAGSNFTGNDNYSGIYEGIDTDDGSRQLLSIQCTRNTCDFKLSDTSFSSCNTTLNGADVLTNGLASASGVNNMASFKFNLACAPSIGADVEATDKQLTGNLKILDEGVIQRTGPGFVYYRTGN
jgi:hypothetical protein